MVIPYKPKGKREMTKIDLYTMCIVQDEDQVLLVNRPRKLGFPGYLGAGGKVDFPESLTEGVLLEVWGEPGLKVKDLVFKVITDVVILKKNIRYMFFNNIAKYNDV